MRLSISQLPNRSMVVQRILSPRGRIGFFGSTIEAPASLRPVDRLGEVLAGQAASSKHPGSRPVVMEDDKEKEESSLSFCGWPIIELNCQNWSGCPNRPSTNGGSKCTLDPPLAGRRMRTCAIAKTQIRQSRADGPLRSRSSDCHS